MVTRGQKIFVDVLIPPGDTILEMLEVKAMTQVELANRLGLSKKHINEIIKGKAVINSDTALKLESVFNLPASFWINIESNYQESLVIIKRGFRKI